MKTHYQYRDVYNFLRTACGAWTKRVTVEPEKVTCAQCQCTHVFRVHSKRPPQPAKEER